MGCWSETCLVSNLPINADDPVVAFLIAHDRYKDDEKDFSGTYYATDKVIPISLPIRARYNDYGSIEKVDETCLSILHIKKMFGEKEDLGIIFEKIQDDKVYINGCKYPPRKVGIGLVMIHEEIYETATQKISVIDKVERQKIIEKEILWRLSSKKEDDLFSIYNSVLSYGDRGGLDSLMEIIKHKEDLIKNACAEITERVMFSCALESLRKTWMPHCGKGSQRNGIKPYMKLMEVMAKVAIKGKEPEQLYYEFLCE